MNRLARHALLTLQAAGLLLSAFLVTATFTNEAQVEQRLRYFAVAQVERAADDAMRGLRERIGANGRAERFDALKRRFGMEDKKAEESRERIVPALLALSLSKECGDDCDFWRMAAKAVDSALVQRIARMRIGQKTVAELVSERYAATVRGLIADLRRFGLVNMLVLSLMMGLILFRGYGDWRFTAFSVAITGYVAWAAYGYLFTQNWAMAILTRDWAAMGYQIGMIFVSCLFFDWLFLRAKVTEFVLNAIASALPS